MAASMKLYHFSGYRTFLKEIHFKQLNQQRFLRREKVSNFDRVKDEDHEFSTLVIPGHTQIQQKKAFRRRTRKQVPPPRFKQMTPEQDWTNVWPTAHTFKWSAIPLPVRQGYIQKTECDGIIPGKYANAELMKPPNFLHLTPAHIKKHCDAIKKFCTPWPEGLETDDDCREHFPLEFVDCDVLLDGPSIRDDRARKVTLKFKLGSLNLDYHARDKYIRLLGKDRYDSATDTVTIASDRCPMKKQNYDFIIYSLTALYHESWKTEEWEKDKTLPDMEKYFWDLNPSKSQLMDIMKKQKEVTKDAINRKFEHLTASDEKIVDSEAVQNYKEAVTNLYNKGEDTDRIRDYKTATVKLLLGLKVEQQRA